MRSNSTNISLRDVNFRFEREKVALIGPNGTGKTTLRAISSGRKIRPSRID